MHLPELNDTGGGKGTLQNGTVERGSSVVRRTRNRESPGSNPLCYRFEVWHFRSLHKASVHSAVFK